MEGLKLKWYEQVESSNPTATLNLQSNEYDTRLEEEVTECKNVADRDLPFIFKIETIPKTTCWPKTVTYIMPLSNNAKQVWIAALRNIIPINEKNQYTRLISKCPGFEVTTIAELDKNFTLIGSNNGIYSLNSQTKSSVLLGGVSKVKQISLCRKIGVVVMIEGPNSNLSMICLRVMEGLAKASACSNPIIGTQLISDESFNLFELSKNEMLCAGTQTKIVIMRYNQSLQNYTSVRMLDTAQPCSCIIFREHSLLVGANKFFEIDLRNFTAEEFLDASDNTLLQAVYCYKLNSFPIALIDVGNNEYLVCFNEFGTFVDEFGRRSRTNDLKWTHLPLKIVYRKPYLYVFYMNIAEVMKIDDDLKSIKVNLKGKCLDVSKMASGVYLTQGNELAIFEGGLLFDDDCSTVMTDQDYRFSFSSSMVESLDRDEDLISVSESEVDYNRKRVQFHTDL